MIGLETAFALLNSNKGKVSIQQLIDCFTINPRNILKLPTTKIIEGELANITLFDPDEKWVFEKKHIRSHSLNSPYLNNTLKGKVVGIINRKQSFFNK